MEKEAELRALAQGAGNVVFAGWVNQRQLATLASHALVVWRYKKGRHEPAEQDIRVHGIWRADRSVLARVRRSKWSRRMAAGFSTSQARRKPSKLSIRQMLNLPNQRS